ncbi:flavo protein-like protein [Yarrowia lipolytica]|uniref:Flavo protein-like protein n=1 Tax=Yarrowia lipolytica TaxID=4952 RepID=A0A371C246_YARLL|nr:flavo protein-like protein [Yarrowia lipolytica]RDW30963.1 flavo protein-like protein [Yarrowia lipolytica]RDW37802.1 flavo protein-like protein [Yarrowia lipolytica]RDW47126.1 flavo protein-like protein [Yarrowia lipolytica]RDW53353.1 flavo protein-like protein [Yarrowia lipolytica]
MPKIAILIYSTYGHIAELARKEAEGVKAAGGQVDLYQVEETLSEEILKYMKAPGQPHDFKVLTPADVEVLTGYDGFLFGIPSRFGSFPAQWKTFWDATGGLWATGGLHGKYVGQFVSSGTQGGGQEVLPRNTLSIYVHHGMNYVPLGYKDTFAEQTNLEEVHGGSPWGAGTFADSDGSRTPSPLEEKVAFTQGKVFTEVLIKAEGGAAGATNGVQNGAQQKTLDPKAGGATGNDVTGGEAAAAAGVGAGAVGAGAAPAAGAGAAPPADAATATNTGTTAATGAATTEKGAAGTAGASTGAAANTTTAKPTAAASKPATTEKAAGAKKTNPAKDVKEEKSKCCGICTIM